jgi:hypothetical protein
MSALARLGLVLFLLLPALAHAAETSGSDEAWALYDTAFAASAAGHEQEALDLFRRVLTEHKDTPAAPYASEMVRLIEARRSGVVTSPDARVRLLKEPLTPPTPSTDLGSRLRNEETTSLARAELVIVQSIHGVAFGFEMGNIIASSNPKILALMMMVGGGAGLGISLALTRDGVTPGRALALNSGTAWGAFNGAMIWSLSSNLSTGQSMSLLAVSQFAGLALGNAGWAFFHPSAGDVSLVNSGGIWSAALALMFMGATTKEPGSNLLSWTVLIASDVGLVGGGVLARFFPMSRSRVLVIDAGGILGSLFGFGLSVLVGTKSSSTTFSLGLAGTVLGLGTGAFLSRHWDIEDAPAVSAAVMPTVTGTPAFGLAYRF